MKRACNPIRRSALYVAAVILLTAGCGKSSSGPAAGTVAAKPTPEQSFDVIMATFKRRIEDTPSGFVSQRDGGRSRLMATNKVTSQIIPPAKEGDPYRAQVIVVSETRYSLQRPVEEPDESSKKDDQRNNQRSGTGSLDEPGNTGRGVDILDPGLIASSGDGSSSPLGSPSAADGGPIRRNDEEKRTFELEYKDGRWRLLTAPNPESERAIELAFEESLGTQI